MLETSGLEDNTARVMPEQTELPAISQTLKQNKVDDSSAGMLSNTSLPQFDITPGMMERPKQIKKKAKFVKAAKKASDLQQYNMYKDTPDQERSASIQKKSKKVKKSNVDRPQTPEVNEISPEALVAQIDTVRAGTAAQNTRFGKRQQGPISLLKEMKVEHAATTKNSKGAESPLKDSLRVSQTSPV